LPRIDAGNLDFGFPVLWILASYITVASLGSLSLVIAFFWWNSLMGGAKGFRTFLILVALPAILLIAEALLLIFTSHLFERKDRARTNKPN
jgi:hypothetical protein